MSEAPTIRQIMLAVSRYYGVSMAQMLSPSRKVAVSHPRQLAMHLARKLTTRSLPEIGMAFHRDHTTAVHATQVVPERLAVDQLLAEAEQDIIASLAEENAEPEPEQDDPRIVTVTLSEGSRRKLAHEIAQELALMAPVARRRRHQRPARQESPPSPDWPPGNPNAYNGPEVKAYEPKQRKCMRCLNTFVSEGPHHRHCDDCREALARADSSCLA